MGLLYYSVYVHHGIHSNPAKVYFHGIGGSPENAESTLRGGV